MTTHSTRQQSGFTLVELLIVVIILAILAAIVVPQFSSTTDDAKQSTMQSNLAAMRSAMELYYIQHGEYPGNLASTQGTGGCSVPGTWLSGAKTGAAFAGQMLYFTDGQGAVCDTKSATYKFGPYIKGGALPSNDVGVAESNGVVTVPNGSDGLISLNATGTLGGWYVDTESGLIVVNHTSHDDL